MECLKVGELYYDLTNVWCSLVPTLLAIWICIAILGYICTWHVHCGPPVSVPALMPLYMPAKVTICTEIVLQGKQTNNGIGIAQLNTSLHMCIDSLRHVVSLSSMYQPFACILEGKNWSMNQKLFTHQALYRLDNECQKHPTKDNEKCAQELHNLLRMVSELLSDTILPLTIHILGYCGSGVVAAYEGMRRWVVGDRADACMRSMSAWGSMQ